MLSIFYEFHDGMRAQLRVDDSELSERFAAVSATVVS